MRFSKRKLHCLFLSFQLQKEKQKNENLKWKRAKKPIKIVFKVVIKNEKNKTNGFLAELPDTIWAGKREKRHFRSHYLFGQKCLGPKQENSGTTIKIVASA